MGLKKTCKGVLNVNGRLTDFIYQRFGKGQEDLIRTSSYLSKNDCIEDYSELQLFRKSIKERTTRWYSTDANLSNRLIYGIWESMFGGFSDEKIYTLPSVEHGLIFHDSIFTDSRYTARPSIVTFGDYRYGVIRRFVNRPIFRVGPYIQYAEPYYTEEEMSAKKKRLGRTLLVFPSHGTNESEVSHDQIAYLEKVKCLAKDFDSVIINVFWWNLCDPIVERFESEGFKVVSAGFRDDPRFLSRLKTIIELSDLVVGDEIGTHVGYALSLKRPYIHLPVHKRKNVHFKDKNEMSGIDVKIKSDLIEYFDGEHSLAEQLNACDPYWGFSHSKSEDELSAICSISQDIARLSNSWVGQYKRAAKNLLELFVEKPIEKRLLSEALTAIQ